MVNFSVSEAPRTFTPHVLRHPKIGSSSTSSFLSTPRLIKLVKSKWVCKALNLSSSVYFALNGLASCAILPRTIQPSWVVSTGVLPPRDYPFYRIQSVRASATWCVKFSIWSSLKCSNKTW